MKSFLLIFYCMVCVGISAQTNDQKMINEILDQWHHAAAVADEKSFFGTMTEDCIYLGTDSGERWLRDSLRLWSAPYFKRESAWDFTPVNRNVVIYESDSFACFDELLDTWMGICRGSGLMRKVEGEWKLCYYHLAVTVKNENMDKYLEVFPPGQ